MMSKEQFEDLTKILESIDKKLDLLVTLQKRVSPKPNIGKEEAKVLQLCNRKHTIEGIVKETGKTENNVNVILSRLREKGRIRSIEIKGVTVYEKI
jgi:hypothetical protein